MDTRTLLIKISNGRIFLNPDFSIPLLQTNIPVKALMFKPYCEFYWLVTMERFDANEKKLFLNVQDYNVGPSEKFNLQKPKDEIRVLSFTELDWYYLEPQLSYYTKKSLGSIVKNIPGKPVSTKLESPNVDFSPSPQKSIISVKFDVPFADASFNLGYVRFQKHIAQ